MKYKHSLHLLAQIFVDKVEGMLKCGVKANIQCLVDNLIWKVEVGG
jgi:hypothetical protein